MNPDHNIDRVLDALRNAAPAAGMERRIVNVLEIEARRSALSVQSKRTVWRRAAACCAGLVAAVVIGAFALRHSAPVVLTAPTASAQPSTDSPSTAETRPEVTRTAPAARTHSAAVQRSAEPRRVEVAGSEDTLVSHPAPPIPLTEQERILLRYARYGNTGDLAQISNERKAAKEDQEKQEFQAFFAPPPIKIGESE